ncbi:MAG: L-2-amino-thiazoline-4-carboxylic acid hydrolase [Candidatus Marinimicrobia bacterium]|nr:L-2-amino-thiazoline-4-carboxylic acid hydrolase [Candidatus Neomarinimicrobiota bacterium]
MPALSKVANKSRRQFITQILPACTLSCLGFNQVVFGKSGDSDRSAVPFETRIKTEYGKSVEDVWRLRYNHYINTMEFIAKELGRNILIDLLKKKYDEYERDNAADKPDNTFSKFTELTKKKISGSYSNYLDVDIIVDSDEAFEIRVHNCLWAKTFQDKDAGDIGYATICYGDFAKAKVYSSHMHLRLTKTLMNGDDCCDHCYTWHS